MKKLSRPRAAVAAGFALVLFATAPALAASPVVDAAWLKAHLGDEHLVILDVTAPRFYAGQHVPGAVFSAFGKWREKRGDVVGMLPPPEKLAKMIGELGIGNDDHVVIVPGGYSAGDVGKATRVFWTFKTLGDDNISILDGGMRAWLACKGCPVQKKTNAPKPKTFTAHFTDRWLARAKDVEQALVTHKVQIVDNRPVSQHTGVSKSGAVTRYGAIPGALNVPETWVVSRGKFRPLAQLKKLHLLLGVLDGPTIHSCNTGHKASLGWFVRSQIMGHDDAKLYDGSLAEWSRLPAAEHPVIAKLPVNE